MGNLTGYINVEIIMSDGDIEEIEIDADEFSLEEEKIIHDRNSINNSRFSSIYRARSQGIQLQLNAITTNYQVLEGYPTVEIIDIEDPDIEKAVVTDFKIDERSLLPPTDENDF